MQTVRRSHGASYPIGILTVSVKEMQNFGKTEQEAASMNKYLTAQRYVYKIHTSRLRRAKWKMSLTINQARENRELISLSESQLTRFIDELNGILEPEVHIAELKSQIKKAKRADSLTVSGQDIRKLYQKLDRFQLIRDFLCVVIDHKKDYQKIYRDGFTVNGITYRRLLGTTGGVKNNTIIFVNEKLLPELQQRIDNGRNLEKPFTPAKLEAYRALVCSASLAVSMPRGVVVVPDCITRFRSDVIELDDTNCLEPSMKFVREKEIQLTDSDGYGMAMPELMERWGRELGKNYILPGCVIRNSFCKGAVFPVDFRKFAREHQVSTVTDVWGNTHPIEQVELVLTASMLKLWDSYASMDYYLDNCKKNHYTFSVTKSSDETLEHMRAMNYQFLQSYDFTDDQIDELIAPTVNEIKDILSNDYRKAILYAKGTELNEKNVRLDCSFATALMIEPLMANDPYVRNQLWNMIKKRIDDAKVGVLNVPGNYSLVSGDPYSLCQSMFGLKVTGLLRAGEVYSKYWVEKGVDQIVSFRAPMTSHNNIRLLHVVHSDQMDEFYQYMTTPTVFNSWDTCADAMNGFDKDGDCVINTSLPLLIRQTRELPAIVCVQHKASKCIPTEDDLMQSNIDCFGSEVGAITNRITSMYEVQARYPHDSREYEILDYRIKCGQLYQQNQIDKAKGIAAKDMPKHWYQKTQACGDIAADKKPYFMQYIYPAEHTRMNAYIKKNSEKCTMRFRLPLEELLRKEDKTPEEAEFILNYEKQMPLGTAPCTMNRICRKIEAAFDGVESPPADDFDYSILKCDTGYSVQQLKKISKLYEQYRHETGNYMKYAKANRIKPEEKRAQKQLFTAQFRRQCLEQCPNEEVLCNIVLDLCYSKSNSSKQFAWDVCGDVIIRNLLKRHHNIISYPVRDENGDIEFHGIKFRMKTEEIKWQ